jgi:hypothetical protein
MRTPSIMLGLKGRSMNALVGILIGLAAGVLIGRRLERSSWILRANGETPHNARGRFFFIREEGVTTAKPMPDVRCPECNAPCYMPRGEGGDWWCPNLECKTKLALYANIEQSTSNSQHRTGEWHEQV